MGWPCDWRNVKEAKGTVLLEIVWNLPRYARDAAYFSGEIYQGGGSLYQGFKDYCRSVKDYLYQSAKDADASNKPNLLKYANEACDLIDTLLSWVEGRLNPYRDDEGQLCYDVPCSFDELARKWDTVVLKLDANMSLQGVKNGQDESPLEENKEFELDLNDFNKCTKGSYVLLIDLLKDDKREGVTLKESRHGKKQPKELRDVLSGHGLGDLRKEIGKMKNGKIRFKISPKQIRVTHKKTK